MCRHESVASTHHGVVTPFYPVDAALAAPRQPIASTDIPSCQASLGVAASSWRDIATPWRIGLMAM
jgi:hypothetical protein